MGPLDGFKVVDLSSGIAGAYCTKLLNDAGADVVKVESGDGDWLRRWSASQAPIGAGQHGALFGFLARSKKSVLVDSADAGSLKALDGLLNGADAVVLGRASGVAAMDLFNPDEMRCAYPHLIVTSISPFGLHGPWRDRPATEFTLQAWSGGIIGLGRGTPDRPPVHVGGRIGEWLSGAFASAATMAARLQLNGAGTGDLIDVSTLEVEIACLTYHSVAFFDVLGRPFRSERNAMIPGVSVAKDGLVALGCGTAQQWFDLCAMVGHPEWIDESAPFSITGEAKNVAVEIAAWMLEHTIDEIRQLATAFRIPSALVANGANITEMDHYRERGSFTTTEEGHVHPGAPYRFVPPLQRTSTARAPRLGEHTAEFEDARAGDEVDDSPIAPGTSSPLQGLRVLDMTTFWAGPSCTHMLTMQGAEVIHLESTSRPDGTRLIAGVPVTEDHWWERSPIFSGLNTNKKSVTLDFRSERGREVLRQLIASCDVVVENYTPRVLEQIGLDYASMRTLREDVILVRMPGFGLDGPWRDHPAFAYVIEDASGLTWLTGHPDQNPVEPYAVGDPCAGIHALNALLVALAHRQRTGAGALVEAAMVDAAMNVAAEQVIEYSAYGALLTRAGNRGPSAAPQNLYRSADVDEFGGRDSWVAVAVETDEQWAALLDALGNPAWATRPELAHASGRTEHHDDIDAQLAQWCETRSGDEIVDVLWSAGVPVGKVMQPHRVADLPQIVARGFYEVVDHPISRAGRHSTLPFTASTVPSPRHRTPAPLLGQHNVEVLEGLGLSPQEIADLRDDGIIGDAPTFGSRRERT